MSNELATTTEGYVLKALKTAQDANKHHQGWCNRDPKKWALVAQHIIQQPCSIDGFRRDHSITKNFYFDVKTELMADPECQAIRNAWGAEVASIMFEGLENHRKIQNKFGDAIDSGEITVDENVVFKSGKSLQALNDIHAKLTGNNIQRHIVEHKTTLDEAAEFARNAIKDAEIVDVDEIH
jgi:hypothetical protein